MVLNNCGNAVVKNSFFGILKSKYFNKPLLFLISEIVIFRKKITYFNDMNSSREKWITKSQSHGTIQEPNN